MSQPIPGTPTPAPANGPAPSATDPAPTNGPAGQPNPTGTPAPTAEPPKDDTDWKGHSKTWEARAKANKAAADAAEARAKVAEDQKQAILKAAGLAPDDDPVEAAKRAATERDDAVKRAEAAEAKARQMELADIARTVGEKAGANVPALINTYSFRTALAELSPDAGEKEISDLVKAELEKNAYLKAAAPPPARSHTDSKGSPPEARKRTGGLSGAVQRAMQPN
jgi:hypothetical protein